MAHAACAFYPSPFERGRDPDHRRRRRVGHDQHRRGEGETVRTLAEIHYPHSLGLLYSAFTVLLRLQGQLRRVQADGPRALRRAALRRRHPRAPDRSSKPDGSYRLDMRLLRLPRRRTMVTNERFDELFGGPPRAARDRRITRREMDLAASIQQVTEEIVLGAGAPRARDHRARGSSCLAGGVALNCVANGKLLRERIFDGSGSSRRRATPAARWAPRWWLATSTSTCRAGCPRTGATPSRAAIWARPSRAPRCARSWTATAIPSSAIADRARAGGADRRGAGRRQGRRLPVGTHGVRPALARRAARSSATRAAPTPRC